MIVVTGAAGFIGSNVVAALNARGRPDIVAVDSFRHTAKDTRYLHELRIHDTVDKDRLARWLDEEGASVEAIIHQGACSDTTLRDRNYVIAVNTDYTRMLWQWCTRAGKPLVYASSAATYGDGLQGYDDRADPRMLKPLNLYGESKQLFDLWALDQVHTPPRWAGLKYFNVYGPREAHKGRMASVAFHAYQQIRESGRVTLFTSYQKEYADGGQRRDFVYVGDAVEATLHLLETPVSAQAPNGLYNVGTGQARTFADLAGAVFAAVGRDPVIEYIPMPEDLRDRYQYFTQARIDKLRHSGFTRPFRSIEEGVRHYVAYLRAQESSEG
ncbi:MAG: ADP-glyceromanno-heptose 6-epimerase precursor, ADP-L-glycero-D-manno-heptose 6-epimerase [candidate division NC10 bacterium CSP1-5]|nr:MAG: ADP-glyceromanno-heptose 6-epimerase precursor, ADP-L-glycero-D-manno-heptose 6-epimerase [candidate division NC10 bacterium CSP1-5]